MQLVVTSLAARAEPGDDEVHPDVDRFFRVERGEAKCVFNEGYEHLVLEGDAVVVPATITRSTRRRQSLKPYTLCSPPNHPDGTV